MSDHTVGVAGKMDKVLELLGKESKGASLAAVKKALDG